MQKNYQQCFFLQNNYRILRHSLHTSEKNYTVINSTLKIQLRKPIKLRKLMFKSNNYLKLSLKTLFIQLSGLHLLRSDRYRYRRAGHDQYIPKTRGRRPAAAAANAAAEGRQRY